jgi:hypothetical protein
MKFALVNGHKMEPQPNLHGNCANCQNKTVSKCGQVKIWHWAHKSKQHCDPWWENETEWHRGWKNNFPAEWQENIHFDSITGEKHIADIKTASGLIIEFQHSAIPPTEIQSREVFYKNMLWVVDGTRLKRDSHRFFKQFSDLMHSVKGLFLTDFPDECFPASWLRSSVPVYFDFQDNNSIGQQDEMHSALWCLFPGRIGRSAVVAGVQRKQFIELTSTAPHLLFAREKISYIAEYIRLQRSIVTANAGIGYPNNALRGRKHRRL